MFSRHVLLAVALSAGAAGLNAHPEIEEALARINGQIAASPADASLYVERGELYAKHEDWISAEANYLRAAELAPDNLALARARGALAAATGQVAEACEFFDRVLRANPRDAEVLVLRARARVTLKTTAAAVADYDAALALIAEPTPALLLERAALVPPPEALRFLDAAIARVGPAISLQLRALALEESLGRLDAALARLDELIAQSERKEAWLKRRGDLLLRAGRENEARAAYAAALAAIAALPEWLRESPDTVRLAAELARLAPATAEPTAGRPARS